MKMIGIICIICGCIILLYLLLIMPRITGKPDRIKFFSQKLYAHRGLFDNSTEAPENSMAAFEKAVKAGYGIELDVQLTKDKIPVVFHDDTLKRVCNAEGFVYDYTFAELQQFTLCGSSQRIPKFSDVLDTVDGKVPLIVEYKIHGMCTEVCAVADTLLQEYKGDYCIESFHPMALYWYRRNRKEVMRGQLSMNFIKAKEKGQSKPVFFVLHHLLLNFLTKPDFIAYNHSDYRNLSRNICRYLYKNTAVAWTIRSEEELLARRRDFDLFIFDSFVPAEKVDKLMNG